MKKPTVILIAIVLVLAAAGAAFALTRNSADDTPASTSTGSESSSTITYGDDGFSQPTVTVKAGSSVTIKNDSIHTLDFASDDHPTHRKNTELNVGVIESGQSRTFTPATAGTWGIHNHDIDTHTMTLVVE